MKKNFCVSLDKEIIDLLQPYLEKNGMSISGFFNQAAHEYIDAIRSLNLPEDVSKMPLGEFMRMFSKMVKGMKGK
jgi:hypothetical protein